MHRTLSLAAMLALLSGPSLAVDGEVSQISVHMGEMTVTMGPGADRDQVQDGLRFEPFQMLDELLFRDDLVFLMRHGPTDWSKRDEKDVAPSDCQNQRVMTPEGRARMTDLGILMAANDVRPGKIVVSEWCRNQQTLDALLEGMALVDQDYVDALPVETDPELNLLLSLQGAADVTELRRQITDWDGSDADGPLLLITHYTNIEELTEFRVYEGEMLMVDPVRENRVLGYLRLRSAAPDVGHFNTTN